MDSRIQSPPSRHHAEAPNPPGCGGGPGCWRQYGHGLPDQTGCKAISGQIGQKLEIFRFKVMLKTLGTIKLVLKKENHPWMEVGTQPHFYSLLPTLNRLLVFLPEGGRTKGDLKPTNGDFSDPLAMPTSRSPLAPTSSSNLLSCTKIKFLELR